MTAFMKTLLLKALAFLAAITSPLTAVADNETNTLKLPVIFGDNMVLQREQAVPIWGWSAPGASVVVKFAGQTKSTRANTQGHWTVKLRKLGASSEPQSLVVESGTTIIFTNVLV